MRVLFLLATLLLCSCSYSQTSPDLPYRTWYVGLLAPNYMEVWVESVDVIDQRGLIFQRVAGGTVAIQTMANAHSPRGWPARVGSGAIKPVSGVDLPRYIFIRWQSLAEPETYHVNLTIPAWVREEMVKPLSSYCRADNKVVEGLYRKDITIGLAPGGIAKAWLGGPCLEPLEIGRFEGAVHELGPSQGQNDGRYALPLSPESKAYIDAHGIPFGSW